MPQRRGPYFFIGGGGGGLTATGGFAEGKADLSKLKPLAQTVLDARDAHPAATLADLYDPDTMPPALRRAHRALDRAVDRLYRRNSFATERERVEHLFALYEKMRAPLEAGMRGKKRRRAARSATVRRRR